MLQPGDEAPSFALQDASGKVWRSEDLKGQMSSPCATCSE